MKPKTFVFLGRSGSGKGTQATLLKEYLAKHDPSRKIIDVETGAKLRELRQEKSFAAEITREVIEHGNLMPAALPIWIWTDFMVKNVTGNEHLMFDGVSRRAGEAPILDEALVFFKRETPYIVHLHIDNDEATGRLLKRGRHDDTHDYIKSRLGWFEEHSMSAVDVFRNSQFSKFLEINGQQPIEKVHADIIAAVDWA